MFEGVEVRGTFDLQKFYDALARIWSEKCNLDFMVKVTPVGNDDMLDGEAMSYLNGQPLQVMKAE